MTQTLLLIMAFFVVSYAAISYYYDNWINKLAVITLFVCLANAIYFSLDGVKGWPAEEPKELKGNIASIIIVNPSSDDAGGIYVSVFLSEEPKWYEYVYPRYAPKTFYIKYTNSRAAKFEKAKQALEEGKEVRINGIPAEQGTGDGEEIDSDGTDDVTQMLMDMINKILPNQKDTYKPDAPNDIEIVERGAPPAKGKSQ